MLQFLTFNLDPVAHKALSLRRDAVFKLLMVMMGLLGWLAAVGVAGTLVLHSVYKDWHLQQQGHISIYLMPDSDPAQIESLEAMLQTLPGVQAVHQLDQDTTRALVAPYVGDTQLPLPKVIDLEVGSTLERAELERRTRDIFPLAEIDDARDMLVAVGRGVRTVQSVATTVAVAVFAVLALLVSLVVRTGLRTRAEGLRTLQHIGATDGFVVDLVTVQVLHVGALGALMAMALGAASLGLTALAWPQVTMYADIAVWLGLAVVPLVLWFVVVVIARMSAYRVAVSGAGI